MEKRDWVKSIGKKLRDDMGDCLALPQEMLDVLTSLRSDAPSLTGSGSGGSARGASARNGNNKEFMERMRTAHPKTHEPVSYQLDFVTPGINPFEASSRNVRRETLNRRMKARRRPLTSQRFTTRVGLASRGNCERAI